MASLSRADLWSLEEYAEERPAFRSRIMEHKKTRQLALGDHARLYFEDLLTIRYQVQEMLRIEKVFEADGINEEIAAYNPMVPSGRNFKATYMIEYTDAEVRAVQLEKMGGIEDLVWMQVTGFDKVWAIADEDLERSTESKTSAVHFMRFEMSDEMAEGLKNNLDWQIGVQHPAYSYESSIEGKSRDSLLQDLV